MSKVWLIAQNEYKRNVFKKSFILALLSVPALIVFNVGLGLILISMERDYSAVGYVDHSGLLAAPKPIISDRSDKQVELLPFQSEDEARLALEAEQIQAYYVIAPDYYETTQVTLVYLEEPGSNVPRQFYDFIQTNLLAEYPPEVIERATSGSDMIIRTPDGMIEFPASGPSLGDFLQIILSIAFVFLIMMSSGYLMGGVVEEKQNRTMEVMVTSVSTSQMVLGKILGIVAISLTQLTMWILFGVLAIFVGGEVMNLEAFQNLEIPWGGLLTVVAIAVPAYVLASALMFALGSSLVEMQEAQSVGGIFFMLHMIPIYAIVALVENPNGILAMALTFLPFTSLAAVGFRSLFAVIPVWQVALVVALQIIYAIGGFVIAILTFRLGMLRYGQRVRLREIFNRPSTKAREASLP